MDPLHAPSQGLSAACPTPWIRSVRGLVTSLVKFGGTFETEMRLGVIVDVLAIGLARFIRALRQASGQRRSNQ
jgi:hypothetical protein